MTIGNGVLWCFSPFLLLFSCIWSIYGILRVINVEEPISDHIWTSALLILLSENIFASTILTAAIIIICKVVGQYKKDEKEARINHMIESGDFYGRRSTFIDMIIDRLDLVSSQP
jgi:hypothetical protein